MSQYTAAAGASLGYDERGNLTSIGADGYTYSSENLLKTGPGSAALAYDPLLRLYQVTKGTTTRFTYDGLAMAGEYNSAGTLTERYVHGPGSDEPLVWYHGRSEAHTSELQSLMRISYAVFCLPKNNPRQHL